MLVNGRTVADPQSIRYESPEAVGTALDGEPLLTWAWEIRLRYTLNASPEALRFWKELLGKEVTLVLPSIDGCQARVVGYVKSLGYDIDPTATLRGVDVTISPVYEESE